MSTLEGASPVVMIFTRDRPAATAFYCDTLGLRLLKDDGFATIFDMNGVPLRLTEIKNHVASPHTVLGWSVRDIAATMAALSEKGVRFEIYEGFGQDDKGVWTSPDGAAKVAWFFDPDGNNLSLTQTA